MFLKSLEIFGFKSFADRTRVSFSDGITALLGPNGCGKSNVVDAIKWVLGEQASKTLRAEKMEDVIFNGTETRKPLSVAEVILTIANEEGLLPLDVSEISIKRRLFRSGESEYFINGAQAKLKEVRELFWDTGVGKTAYSVMEQGKIDQILSSKPEDRRYIFEEAAGITRFKARGAEAERKLARTEENMRQAEVILSEVKRSYDSLKIQADKTVKYRALKDDVFKAELDIQLLRLRGFLSERERRARELEDVRSKRDAAKADIDAVNASLEENLDAVNEMEKRIAQYNQEIYGLAIEQKAKIEQAKGLVQQQNDAKRKIEQLEVKRGGIEERIETLRGDADEQNADLRNLRKRTEDVEKNIADFEKHIAAAAERINGNEAEIARAENVISELGVERAQLEAELRAITEDIVTELDGRLRDAGYSSRNKKKAEDQAAAVLEQLRVLAAGRAAFFKDFAALEEPSRDDVRKFADAAVAAFDSIGSFIEELAAALENYRAATPGFIDDFLSPDGIITQKRAADDRVQKNGAAAEEKRTLIVSFRDENAALQTKIEEYRATLEELKLNRVQMKTQMLSAEDQVKLIQRELSGQENALRELENELYTETSRLEDFQEKIGEIESEVSSLERKGRTLTAQLEKLENDVTMRTSDVSAKQETLKKKSAELGKLQGMLEKLHTDAAAGDTEIRNLKDNFREQYSRDLMEFEERMFAINAPAASLREARDAAKQALKDLGGVNLMAPEEFAETKERYDFLTAQLADLGKARDDLRRVTGEIRAESTEQFLATYNKIKKNFHNMFRRLFGGGRGELRLVNPENVLESGIDIFAQPPGKKLENISLLSGGEKSMTAVALLFATYMVKPSPFCLLDEIDAALDEQNVSRFVTTLREFGSMSQYIVITHNKKTVVGAGTMLGVTMEESGVTKIISVKLENPGDRPPPAQTGAEPFEEEDVPPEENVYIPPHTLRDAEPLNASGSDAAADAEESSENSSEISQ